MKVIALWEGRLIQGFHEKLYIWVGTSCLTDTFYGMACKDNNANANENG